MATARHKLYSILRCLRTVVPLFALLLASGPALGQQKTPNHVYQAVGVLEQEVKRILEADFMDWVSVPKPPVRSASPRHVYAKLIEVDGKLATLRRLNGLPKKAELSFPARKVSPSDVFEGVDTVGRNLDELLRTYGLDEDAAEENLETLPAGKAPGDVYARLAYVSALIDQADIPAIVPNDVFRLAATIRDESMNLAVQAGVFPIDTLAPASGKSPADVLVSVTALSDALAELAVAREDLAPSSGVVTPPASTGPVTPARVLDAMNLVLADLQEMRVAAGVDAPIDLAPVPTGMTPSDVFAQIEAARAAIAQASL